MLEFRHLDTSFLPAGSFGKRETATEKVRDSLRKLLPVITAAALCSFPYWDQSDSTIHKKHAQKPFAVKGTPSFWSTPVESLIVSGMISTLHRKTRSHTLHAEDEHCHHLYESSVKGPAKLPQDIQKI